MFGIGMPELLMILGVALIVIGPKKLPEVARTLAKGLREIRRASDDIRYSIMIDDDDPPPRYRPPPPPAKTLGPRGSQAAAPDHAAGADAAAPDRAAPDGVTASDDDTGPAGADTAAAGITGSRVAGAVSRGDPGVQPIHDPDDADDHGPGGGIPSHEEIDRMMNDVKRPSE